jgi:hypothetical protein
LDSQHHEAKQLLQRFGMGNEKGRHDFPSVCLSQ